MGSGDVSVTPALVPPTLNLHRVLLVNDPVNDLLQTRHYTRPVADAVEITQRLTQTRVIYDWVSMMFTAPRI